MVVVGAVFLPRLPKVDRGRNSRSYSGVGCYDAALLIKGLTVATVLAYSFRLSHQLYAMQALGQCL